MIWGLLVSVVSLLYAYWFYQLVIGLRGLPHEKRPEPVTPQRRFAIVVPAHDEEVVVGHLVDSLTGQTYPRELFGVFVIADGCTDQTAQIARGRGAAVLVREGVPSGKGGTLGWAFARISLDQYDYVAVFDADNVVAADWLASMNAFLERHPAAEVVQGYIDSKNPRDSWVTRVYALQYWYLNRFWSLARSRWRLSVNVGGTGFVIRTRALRRIGWVMESLTEDLELTCKIVAAGGRVWWNEWAVSYDEKPTSSLASRRQRTRWLKGHYWLARRYMGKLFTSFIRTGGMQYLDLLLHLLVPGRSAMSYAPMFAGLVPALVRTLGGSRVPTSTDALLAVFVSCSVVQIGLQLVVSPSLHERRLTLNWLRDLVGYFAYGLAWLPVAVVAVVRSSDQRGWLRTEHTRGLSVGSISSGRERD